MNDQPISTTETPRKSKRNVMITGVIALTVLLAGAAFVEGRLLNLQALAGSTDGTQRVEVHIDQTIFRTKDE
jgi:hypothetical protein